MTKYFPPIDRNYTLFQANRGDIFGSIWSTQGIDLQSRPGAALLADKLVTNTTAADDAQLGLPVAFEYFGARWWAVCGDRVFKTADEDPAGAFTEDASTNFATDFSINESDLCTFDGRLWATSATKLLSKTSASADWTVEHTINSGSVHKMVNFRKTNRLYFADGDNTVLSIDENDDVPGTDEAYTLVLPGNNYDISTMAAGTDSIWIGLKRASTTLRGAVARWDGVANQITTEYPIPADGVVAMKMVDDVPIIVDTDGAIRRFDGSGFTEIARFPTDGRMLRNVAARSAASNRAILMNSIEYTKNNTLLIGVNPIVSVLDSTTIVERMAAGVYECDLSNGNLTHKYSFTTKTLASTSPTDYAQIEVSKIGAIKLNMQEGQTTNGRVGLLAGADIYTNNTTTQSGIFIQNSIPANEKQKVGKIVSTWFHSDQITDNWQKLWVTFRKFLNSTDKMVFKYRTEEEDAVLASITWVNTTSFTTTTDVSAYAAGATGFGLSYGGEVEFIRATGAGACRHITTVVNNAGTYTVTIDAAVTGVTTGTAKARFQKWIKLEPEVTGQVNAFAEFPITVASPRIQIKGYFEWTGNNEFYKAVINNTSQLEAQA